MDKSGFTSSMGNNRKNQKFRTKCSLKTCIVLSSSDIEGSLYCDHKKKEVFSHGNRN